MWNSWFGMNYRVSLPRKKGRQCFYEDLRSGSISLLQINQTRSPVVDFRFTSLSLLIPHTLQIRNYISPHSSLLQPSNPSGIKIQFDATLVQMGKQIFIKQATHTSFHGPTYYARLALKETITCASKLFHVKVWIIIWNVEFGVIFPAEFEYVIKLNEKGHRLWVSSSSPFVSLST